QLGEESLSTNVDPDGKWKVVFPARVASKIPVQLSLSSHKGTVARSDSLVGDVWLAAGQSNMQRTIKRIGTKPDELARADISAIRQFAVATTTFDTPQLNTPGEWMVCTPE